MIRSIYFIYTFNLTKICYTKTGGNEMEYLDTYDENKNFLGKQPRKYVHENALWHNTVHCWLYDKEGNVYFQIRKDEQTFYTTASGHVSAGETVKEAFGREIKEEIGIDIEYEKAELVNIVKFQLDRENKDGSMFKDRAFANVYVYLFDGDITKFHYDKEEVVGIVKVNAEETLHMFEQEQGAIQAVIIQEENRQITETKKEVELQDFLVNQGETALTKYGDVLKKVIELSKEKSMQS